MTSRLSNAKIPFALQTYTPGLFHESDSLRVPLETVPRAQPSKSATPRAYLASSTPRSQRRDAPMSANSMHVSGSVGPVTPVRIGMTPFGPPSSNKRAPFSYGKSAMPLPTPPPNMLYSSSWRTGAETGAAHSTTKVRFTGVDS